MFQMGLVQKTSQLDYLFNGDQRPFVQPQPLAGWEVKVPVLENGRVRQPRWDYASHDQPLGLFQEMRWRIYEGDSCICPGYAIHMMFSFRYSTISKMRIWRNCVATSPCRNLMNLFCRNSWSFS